MAMSIVNSPLGLGPTSSLTSDRSGAPYSAPGLNAEA